MAAMEKVSTPRSGAHTVIGSSIVIDGEISGDEDLVIQGTVKGKIDLKESLYVESSGVIEADIETANVEVSGQVTGNIAASDKVELKADCKVVGDIRAPRILIADASAARAFVDAARSSDKRLVVYEGFRHEIFNERERERPVSEAVAWLTAHVS